MSNEVLADVRLSYLTEEELKTVKFMKAGEPIAGRELTDNAVNIFIKTCLSEKASCN